MINTVKTGFLLSLMTVLIIVIGRIFGGQQGMIIAFIFAIIMNVGSYWFSDKIVLSIYRARPVSESEAPELYRIVRELSQEAGIPMPRIYVIPNDSPNAFATGRNPKHAVVAVTEGLLSILDREEIKGVLAHEISHVKNRDILIQTIAATMAGAIMMLANMARWGAIFGGMRGDDDDSGGVIGLLAMSIIAPIAALLIQMAISRSREYLADETGARIAHNPLGLASALEKLSIASQRIPLQTSPASAHLFIVNPLKGGRSLLNLFSTHPPIEERIKRLREMAISGM